MDQKSFCFPSPCYLRWLESGQKNLIEFYGVKCLGSLNMNMYFKISEAGFHIKLLILNDFGFLCQVYA